MKNEVEVEVKVKVETKVQRDILLGECYWLLVIGFWFIRSREIS
jgi:hypothetical protein